MKMRQRTREVQWQSFHNEKNPFGFQCQFCRSIEYVPDYKFRETYENYEYEVTCGSCHETQILRQRSVMASLRNHGC